MKKIISILLVTIFAFSLASCDKQQEPTIIGCTTDVVRYDYDDFISIYGQEENATVNSTNSIQSNILIPKLTTDDFYCTGVNVADSYLEFFYNPSYVPQDSYFLNSKGISVRVTMVENSFYEFIKEDEDEIKHKEVISDKYVREESINRWFINDNGRCILIYFPDNIKFSDPESINDYFEFEVLNPSNNNTVTE